MSHLSSIWSLLNSIKFSKPPFLKSSNLNEDQPPTFPPQSDWIYPSPRKRRQAKCLRRDNNERASSTTGRKTRPRRCCIMNGSFAPRPRQSLSPPSFSLSPFPFLRSRTARDRHDLLGGRGPERSIINYFERSRAVDPAERTLHWE